MTDADADVAPAATILQDVWDREEFDEAHETVPPLRAALGTLADASDLGRQMGRDVFAALHQRAPIPDPAVPPSHAINAAVRDAVLESQTYRQLHPLCSGDGFHSGVAVSAMSSEIADLYGELGHVQQAAEQAQAARDAYEAAMANGEPDETDEGASLADLLDQLAAGAADAEAALGEAIAGAEAQIGQAARAAVEAATDEVTAVQMAAATWGLDGGTLATTNPATRFEVMRLLRTDRMRRITEYFGRYRAMSIGAKESRWTRGPDEVYTVHLSDDLEHVLPEELAGLGLPGITEDIFHRWSNRELLCYDLRKREKEGRGPIIFLRDASGSMSGAKYEATTGLGLAMASIAHEDDRAFHSLMFGGVGKIVEQTVINDPASMIEFASAFLNDAGTDFAGPLDRASAIIDDAGDELRQADIVIVSDGISRLTDEWCDRFLERKARLGFRLWAVLVGAKSSAALNKVADHVAELTSLVDDAGDAAIMDLFTTVTTEPA